jgi:LmeA-like phospholipid-binding
MTSKPPSKLIGKILSPALRLWLRSQVESVEDLQISISGRNRQILGGYIPRVSLAANRAVYQGLYFSQVRLWGENIRINLSQVLKGEPLRLLETVTVAGGVMLEQVDLQASLSSPLFGTALKDLLSTLIAAAGGNNPEQTLQDWHINWHTATISHRQLTLEGIVTNVAKNPVSIRLMTQLELADDRGQTLRLHEIEIDASPLSSAIHLAEFNIDLGSDVALELLEAIPGRICLRGGIAVMP